MPDTVIPIDEDEFHARIGVEYRNFLVEERAWWRSVTGRILGTLLRDRYDNDWAYVVLGRDVDGVFKAIDMAASKTSPDIAENELLDCMNYYAGLGRDVFPQDTPLDWMRPSSRPAAR
jgi:hypothetical protein